MIPSASLKGLPVSRIGFLLLLITGFLPIWQDSTMLWQKHVTGFLMFTRSIVFTIAFFGGRLVDWDFSLINLVLTLTMPILILSPFATFTKGKLGRATLGAACLQLAAALCGVWVIGNRYELAYGYAIWLLALTLLAWGQHRNLTISG